MTQTVSAHPFGAALDELLKASGTKQQTLAMAMGVDVSLLSQWKSGKSRIQEREMRWLLNFAARHGLQGRLKAALTGWLVPEPDFLPQSGEEALTVAKAAAGGGARSAEWLIKKILRTPHLTRDIRIDREIRTVYVHNALRLGKPAEAIDAATRLERRAREEHDPESIYRAIFLRAQASRNVAGLLPARMIALHRQLDSAFNAFHPTRPKEVWRAERVNIARDMAAALLRAAMPHLGLALQGRRFTDGYAECLALARYSVDEAIDEGHRNHGLTRLAQVALAGGDRNLFERTYDQIEESESRMLGDRAERSDLLLAEAHVVAGKRDAAIEVLKNVRRQAARTENEHHRARADDFLAVIALGGVG